MQQDRPPSESVARGEKLRPVRRSLPLRVSYALAVYFGRQNFLRSLSIWLGTAVVMAEILAQILNALLGYAQQPQAVAVLTFLVTMLVSCPLILFGVDIVLGLERAQKRRAESEARFRDGIDSMMDGFVMADHANGILLWNKAFARLFPRLTPHLVPGMSLT